MDHISVKAFVFQSHILMRLQIVKFLLAYKLMSIDVSLV